MTPVGKGWLREKPDPGDRRSRSRYPLSLPAVYYDDHTLRQSGTTLDISGSGLRFTTPKLPVRSGQRLHVSLSLPGRCDGSVPLTLTLHGIVVRASREEAALKLDRYEFESEACDQKCRQCPKAPDVRKAPEAAYRASRLNTIVLPILRPAGYRRSAG